MLQSIISSLSCRTWVTIAVVAITARILNLLLLPDTPATFLFPDSPDYLVGAAAWLQSGSFLGWFAGEQLLPAERVPGYFWILSGFAAIGMESPGEIAFVQALFDVVTVLAITRLGFFISPHAGLFSGLIAALNPTLIVHSTLVLQDTVFLALFSWGLVCFCLAIQRACIRSALAAGLLLGAALMTRAVVQYLIILGPLFLGIAVLLQGKRPLFIAPLLSVVLLVGALVPVTPLIARNLTHYDTFYPTTQTGLHALYWLVPLVRMQATGRGFDEESRINQQQVAVELQEQGIDTGSLSATELDSIYREIALRELTAMPPMLLARAWAQGAVITLLSPATLSDGRVRALERPSFYETPGAGLLEKGTNYFFDNFGLFQAIVLTSAILSVTAAISLAFGAVVLIRRQPLAALGIFMLVSYFLALGGPTSGPKYRMPMEPVLIVTMAVGLIQITSLYKSKIAKRRSNSASKAMS